MDRVKLNDAKDGKLHVYLDAVWGNKMWGAQLVFDVDKCKEKHIIDQGLLLMEATTRTLRIEKIISE